MTYGEFKKHMAAAGVLDTDEIGYIEVAPLPDGELIIDRWMDKDTMIVQAFDKFD